MFVSQGSTPAVRPGGTDAHVFRRALFEPFDKTQGRLREVVRPPKAGVRPLQ